MRRIILISCVSKKLPYAAKAKDLYISPLFVGNLRYAKSLQPDSIFILSAKYGLLELDREVEPYDTTLKNMTRAQVKAWADKVVEQMEGLANLKDDHFIFLAGETYRRFLVPYITSYEIPLQGMTIGKQLQYLAKRNHESNLP